MFVRKGWYFRPGGSRAAVNPLYLELLAKSVKRVAHPPQLIIRAIDESPISKPRISPHEVDQGFHDDVIAAAAVKQIVRLNVAAVFASTVVASVVAMFLLLTNR